MLNDTATNLPIPNDSASNLAIPQDPDLNQRAHICPIQHPVDHSGLYPDRPASSLSPAQALRISMNKEQARIHRIHHGISHPQLQPHPPPGSLSPAQALLISQNKERALIRRVQHRLDHPKLHPDSPLMSLSMPKALPISLDRPRGNPIMLIPVGHPSQPPLPLHSPPPARLGFHPTQKNTPGKRTRQQAITPSPPCPRKRPSPPQTTINSKDPSDKPVIDISKQASLFFPPEQRQIIDAAWAGKNIFFTGSAGSGKSVLLAHIIKLLHRRNPKEPEAIGITASTGLAACHIGGCTLYSWAGIGTGEKTASEFSTMFDMVAYRLALYVTSLSSPSPVITRTTFSLHVCQYHYAHQGPLPTHITGNSFPLRNQVHNANQRRLKVLPHPAFVYIGWDGGRVTDPADRQTLLSSLMVPVQLELRVGVQVMLIKNYPRLKNYVGLLFNGCVGIVTGFILPDDHEGLSVGKETVHPLLGQAKYPLVCFALVGTDGASMHQEVLVLSNTFKLELPGVGVQPLAGSFPSFFHGPSPSTNLKVRLLAGCEWILKAFFKEPQAMPNSSITGQAYVALSRAVASSSLEVLNLNPAKISPHPAVLEWEAQFHHSLTIAPSPGSSVPLDPIFCGPVIPEVVMPPLANPNMLTPI
ncbi:hypothetical protein JB92DRAFT_2837711 [Gautieria morchelliformis]|nr:hypothetical protein JB92DRAFT_2837711 [Gautieria morchelliformis]